MAHKQTNIRFTPENLTYILEYADRVGLSRDSVVNVLISSYREQDENKKLREKIRELEREQCAV